MEVGAYQITGDFEENETSFSAKKPNFTKSKTLNGSDIPRNELEYMARTMFSEYGDTTNERHLELIASVILNMRDSEHPSFRHNETVMDVVSVRKQFSGFMNKNWRSSNIPNKHWEIARKILNTGVPKEFKNVFFFCNMSIVEVHNPKAAKWFKTLPKFEHHNGHTFYLLK